MLPRFMQSFKILSSKKLKEVLQPGILKKFIQNDKFRFWMPRYDDFLVTSEEQYNRKLNYIHNNPIKAGISGRPEDYPFSSARNWLLGEPGIITIDKDYSWLVEE